MNNYGLIIAVALGLSAFGLSLWAWHAVKLIAKALPISFEGIHYDQ